MSEYERCVGEVEQECTCSTWWIDLYPRRGHEPQEYDEPGPDREQRRSVDEECPVHGDADELAGVEF